MAIPSTESPLTAWVLELRKSVDAAGADRRMAILMEEAKSLLKKIENNDMKAFMLKWISSSYHNIELLYYLRKPLQDNAQRRPVLHADHRVQKALAKLCYAWGEVVKDYDWDKAGQTLLEQLAMLTEKCHRFEDAVRFLNQALLERQKAAKSQTNSKTALGAFTGGVKIKDPAKPVMAQDVERALRLIATNSKPSRNLFAHPFLQEEAAEAADHAWLIGCDKHGLFIPRRKETDLGKRKREKGLQEANKLHASATSHVRTSACTSSGTPSTVKAGRLKRTGDNEASDHCTSRRKVQAHRIAVVGARMQGREVERLSEQRAYADEEAADKGDGDVQQMRSENEEGACGRQRLVTTGNSTAPTSSVSESTVENPSLRADGLGCPLCPQQCLAARVPISLDEDTRAKLFRKAHEVQSVVGKEYCQPNMKYADTTRAWVDMVYFARLASNPCQREESDCWVLDESAFEAFVKSNQQYCRPIVVKSALSDDFTPARCVKRMIDKLGKRKLWATNTASRVHVELTSEELESYLSAVANSAVKPPPLNILDLRPWNKPAPPNFLDTDRHALLEVLLDRVSPAGKQGQAAGDDVRACTSFNILGLRGGEIASTCVFGFTVQKDPLHPAAFMAVPYLPVSGPSPSPSPSYSAGGLESSSSGRSVCATPFYPREQQPVCMPTAWQASPAWPTPTVWPAPTVWLAPTALPAPALRSELLYQPASIPQSAIPTQHPQMHGRQGDLMYAQSNVGPAAATSWPRQT